jgi:Putative lumazine-binding
MITFCSAQASRLSDSQQAQTYINEHAKSTDVTAVHAKVEDYVAAVYIADTKTLRTIFDSNSIMLGDLPGDVRVTDGPSNFLKDLESRPSMKDAGANYLARIEYIDVVGNVATVALAEEGFFGSVRFINYLSLLKDGNEWKIVSKVFSYM